MYGTSTSQYYSVTFKGKLYIFKKNNPYESRYDFIDRCNYKLNKGIDLPYIESLSHVYINHKKGCVYHFNILNDVMYPGIDINISGENYQSL